MCSFTWRLRSGHEALAYVSGIKLRDFYLDAKSCAHAFYMGRKKLRKIFGEDIILPNVSVPHLSYGHISCLGSEIIFPIDSAPSLYPIYSSIEEGLRLLIKRKKRFEDCKLFKHYLKIYKYLCKRFPNEKVSIYGFGWEGPITTAIMLRGTDFLVDMYRKPILVKKFLKELTESIVEFIYFLRRLMDEPEINPYSSGLCDDCSSYIPPKLWDEFVIPYWEQYYSGITSGRRYIHVENLSPPHLKYLEKVRIVHYDPSVSPKLTPKIIKREIKIPFSWRLPSFMYLSMNKEDIYRWVLDSYREGANEMYTTVEPLIFRQNLLDKIKAFIDACKKIR
ncbi:MAG TPA: hypothetical protein ENG40_01690 [Thermoprotei archaeon]|nr:hypothetical protein [Thermoprotei archaeon]